MKAFRCIAIVAMSIVAMMAVSCTNAGKGQQENLQLGQEANEMNTQFVAFMEAVDSLNAVYMADSIFISDVSKTATSDGTIEHWKRDSANYCVGEVLKKISDNPDKYIKGDKVDTDLLYDDVMKYCIECGMDMSGIDNDRAKAILLPLADKLCAMLDRIKTESDDRSMLLNKFLDEVSQIGIVDEEELDAYKDFVVEEIAYCSTLNNEALLRYVGDFNKLVDQSNMALDRKENVKNCMMLIINDRELDR